MSEFEELYNLYYRDVYYFVLKLANYQDDIAEEVTQESFYQAFISLQRFRGECSIKSWLCQIARNTYYKYLKTHAKETYLEEELHLKQEEKATSTVVEEKQMIAHLRKVIADLDERSRSIVEYRLFGEKSYKEIGELTGIREATAKDLMPLCLDHEATEASEQTVIEHLAECKECTRYYEALGKDTKPVEDTDKETKYVLLAAKIRRRKNIIAALVGIVVFIFCFNCLKYSLGYRTGSQAAADLSGRLNFESEVIASFEWKDDFHFYIYDSYSCYDVICVEKTLLGWRMFESCLNWPKWSMYDETIGIETAGALCHYRYDEGVQIFPVIPYDSNIKTVEVTCYGQTQTKEVKTGELALFTFDAISGQTNAVEATAYDAIGNIIYRLEEQGGLRIWVPVTE